MKTTAFLTGAALGALCMWLACRHTKLNTAIDSHATETVTRDTVVISDTIVIRQFLPVAERHAGRRITVANDSDSTARIEVPAIQRVFADSDSLCIAWVSGIDPRLDSLRLTSPRTIISTERHTLPASPAPKRWGVGISAGVALTSRGATPYIGIGVTYTIKSF